MALITDFRPAPLANPAWRSETACGYRIAEVAGRRVLHLETYGSQDRAVPGKGSQYFTLDEPAARGLLALLVEAFPSLR
jgi:hypothetical protein